jgi:hypothetical protein
MNLDVCVEHVAGPLLRVDESGARAQVNAAVLTVPWRKDGQCNGVTVRGARCKNEAEKGSAFCLVHERHENGSD